MPPTPYFFPSFPLPAVHPISQVSTPSPKCPPAPGTYWKRLENAWQLTKVLVQSQHVPKTIRRHPSSYEMSPPSAWPYLHMSPFTTSSSEWLSLCLRASLCQPGQAELLEAQFGLAHRTADEKGPYSQAHLRGLCIADACALTLAMTFSDLRFQPFWLHIQAQASVCPSESWHSLLPWTTKPSSHTLTRHPHQSRLTSFICTAKPTHHLFPLDPNTLYCSLICESQHPRGLYTQVYICMCICVCVCVCACTCDIVCALNTGWQN